MKRTLFSIAAFIAVFTLFSSKASAQSTTGNVPVSIVLSDAFSITLGPTPDVVFTYSGAPDYAGSKTVAKTNHFTVVSNKAYSVSVVATSAFTVNAANATPVPLNIVQVTVDPTTPTTGATYATAALSTTPAALATGATGTVGTAYNINYTIPSAAALIGKAAGTYATNITYSVTQP